MTRKTDKKFQGPIRYDGPLNRFGDEYYENGMPIVLLLIHMGKETLLVKKDKDYLMPFAELVRAERLLGGVHRALIQMVGYERPDTRSFGCDKLETFVVRTDSAPVIFIVHCYIAENEFRSPRVEHVWTAREKAETLTTNLLKRLMRELSAKTCT